MTSNKVIVFGPTGNIGSIAAVRAQELGAKVYLAMRDTSKSISGLSADQEKAGGFERVQADLTQPETVAAAINQTGAKSAYFYAAHGMPDHMKSTIEALKSSGVTFVVFLSSYTIEGWEPADVPPEELIPKLHAEIEVHLEQIYGPENYVAIRPGSFATNTTWWKKGVQAGEVKLFGGEVTFDNVTAYDMGRVSGTVLAEGKQRDGQKLVYIFGPKLYQQKESVKLLSEGLGKGIKYTPVSKEESQKMYDEAGMPPPLSKYLVDKLEKGSAANRASYNEGVSNVEKYTGKPAMSFPQWIQENKHLFD